MTKRERLKQKDIADARSVPSHGSPGDVDGHLEDDRGDLTHNWTRYPVLPAFVLTTTATITSSFGFSP